MIVGGLQSIVLGYSIDIADAIYCVWYTFRTTCYLVDTSIPEHEL